MLNKKDGEFLLKLARDVIKKFVKNESIEKPAEYPEALNEKHGVFCTIHKIINNKKELRGCIGIPYPLISLIDAVISAAKLVCEDPRFPSLKKEELEKIKIEVSILTEPELIKVEKPEDYPKKITKEDGLILEFGPYSGLFLPQVWEQIQDKEDFLDNLCIKAGLNKGMWKEKGVKIYRFHVQIFEE